MKPKGHVKFVDPDRSQFFATLQKRVRNYFRENEIPRHANAAMVIKTITLLIIYISPFVLLLAFNPPFWVSLILWSIMAVGLAGTGMSIMHDMNHGAYFSSKKLNDAFGHIAINLLGASAFNWKFQHNVLHHTYTNIDEMDDDIKDVAMLHFTPHGETKPINRFQHIYAFLIYGLTNIYWVTVKDFLQFAKYIMNGVNKRTPLQNTLTFSKITLLKIGYFFTMLVLPTVFLGLPFWEVLVGFIVMHLIGGFILTVVFQLAHQVDEADFPLPNDKGQIENCWAIHQMNTTVNFAPRNKLISWYVGGLNFQVEHHLFPSISHIHYPKIAPIVRKTAEEFGVPYLVNDTLGEAVRSHIAALKKHGRLPNLNEAMG